MSDHTKHTLSDQEIYQLSVDEVLQHYDVDPELGLSEAEAKRRLEVYGENKLPAEEKTPFWKRLLEQFKDILVIILIIAAVISGFVLGDWVEAALIFAIVLVNAFLGVYQEGKAEDAVEALNEMSSPHARVIRDGQTQLIEAAQIVPGDIIVVEAGDVVPADARLIESSNLKAEEAALTGESVPVEKDYRFTSDEELGIGDRDNIIHSSTSITYGRATAVVERTALDTEMGKIASRLSGIEQEATPLQISLNQLGIYLGVFCIIVVIITFVMGVLRGGDMLDMFMTAVSLAVAAIPEGMSAVVTIVLAIGMNRMVEKNAIVKRLLAVETLGSVNFICSDKTGTLTQNEMTVTRLYTGDTKYEVSGTGYAPEGEIKAVDAAEANEELLERLFTIGALCNEAEIQEHEGSWQLIGDPTEGAMLTVAGKYGITKEAKEAEFTRLGDLPFDSERKMMSVFYDDFAEGPLSLTKGAPDVVIERCSYELTPDGVKELTAARKAEILEQNTQYAQAALRVLSFAYKVHPDKDFSDAEEEMIFVGLMGMIDPARPEAKEAIAVCKDAGIRVVMITGDYKDTAVAIAEDLGLIEEHSKVLTGAEVEALSDAELRAICEDVAVYARVSPEHKVRIVEALQAEGNVVSMTGDGVNDAPALKRADIGVAMGITGTEVSKTASDMILTDDNFATIVSAVEEGRIIYANIRKFVGFLLSCNVGEILVIFITILVMGPDMTPLLPIQLLWLNLVTDSFPALALGREQGEADIMHHPPRDKDAKILDKDMIASIAIQAVAIFIAVFIGFNIGLDRYGLQLRTEQNNPEASQYVYINDDRDVMLAQEVDGELVPVDSGHVYTRASGYTDEQGNKQNFTPSDGAFTYAFITLIMCELFRAFSNRSEHYSVFSLGLFSNATMNKSILLALGLTLVVVYVPFLQPLFNTISLKLIDWAYILVLALIPFVIGELYKLIAHRKTRATLRA